MLKALLAAGLSLNLMAAAPVDRSAKTTCTSDAMIVFDASGSMSASDFLDGAPNRIDRVRQALSKFVPHVSETRNLGLLVYGPGSHRDECENIDLHFKPIPDAGKKILGDVDRLVPDGMTPLTKSVERAAEALGPPSTPGMIVLLTDGEETCRGDPCKLARELRASRPNTVVHVIGYKLQSLDGRSPVSGAKCLADQTGGFNLSADTTEELVNALEKTLGCPELTQRGDRSILR